MFDSNIMLASVLEVGARESELVYGLLLVTGLGRTPVSWAATRCTPAAGVGVGVVAGVGVGVVAGVWRRRWCSQLLLGRRYLGSRHFHLGGGHRLIGRLHLCSDHFPPRWWSHPNR